ncbi:hypothetical protein LIP_2250 [Limnochorda pilosa]|uniref:Uncharacterized protein n=1 Tax=Limnochorda pilosa TaxID=1555112 RepID=A0A0K2SLU2_LIMPI|nr:hypothetical protein LIP_2250 [Limnochorda pilosa]
MLPLRVRAWQVSETTSIMVSSGLARPRPQGTLEGRALEAPVQPQFAGVAYIDSRPDVVCFQLVQ